MSDEFYYESLRIQDEIIDMLILKYGNLSKASKAIGKADTWFYSYSRFTTVKSLLDVCKLLDISIDCALGGKKEKYQPIEITFNGLIKEYEKHIYHHKNDKLIKSLCVIAHRLKRNKQKNLTIKTLLEFMKIYKKPASYLIK